MKKFSIAIAIIAAILCTACPPKMVHIREAPQNVIP